jgi:DNA replication and repair protein RecF
MRVDRLYINGFRNFENAACDFSPGINIIVGKNAQGKTNLLETVYMLCGGRSFRTRFDKELIGFDYSSCEIMAEVFSHDREHNVRLLLSRGSKKTITRNGVRTRPGELAETFRAVLFSPDDLYIIKAGAHERRRFLDMAISQLRPGYIKTLSEYNRLLEHKQGILRDYPENPSLLSALDDFSMAMCRAAAKIIRYRAAFTQRLGEHAARIARDFTGGEELNIAYKTVSSVTDPLGGRDALLEELYEHQETHRQAELASRSCLTGSHRDDLEVFINGSAAKTYASQGQTRTAALSLKLAEREIFLAETGEYPVLLLDDVLSELDSSRQRFILNRIEGGQTLITCCEDEGILSRTGGRVITVDRGQLTDGK